MIYQNTVTITNNEIFDAGAYRVINGSTTLMSNIVKANILSDYSNGIRKFTTNGVVCNNLYYENKQQATDFSKGEVLQVGDIIRIDKDNVGTPLFIGNDNNAKYVKVTSREFIKVGVPLLNIEYMEIIL